MCLSGNTRGHGRLSSLKMVDWSEPKKPVGDGLGGDRGQINKSDEIAARTAQRLEEAKLKAKELGIGSKSGLADVQEGERDPRTGRVVLDPLKIPTAAQGAPGSWAEYMAMRKAKEGVVKDMAGNVIEDAKPTYTVQAGTWGPPKDVEKTIVGGGKVIEDKSVTGFGRVDVSDVSDDAAADWRRKKDEEKAAQQAAVEAKMQMWLKAAAEKKAREGK